MGAEIIDLDVGVCAHAVELIRGYALGNGLQLGDALIAATAITHDLLLFSGNRKHYASIAGLRFEPFVS